MSTTAKIAESTLSSWRVRLGRGLALGLVGVLLASGVAAQEPEAPGEGATAEPSSEGAGEEATEGGGEEAAQEGAPSEDDVFVDQVNVNVVNVDVFVTDKKGNRIDDLSAEDFVLYEDGKQMPITNFYEVSGGRRLDADGEPIERLPTASSMRLEEIRGGEVPDEERIHLVVYVDNFNIRPFNRNRVLGELRRFLLEEVPRDARIMLVSYDRSLHIQQPFTSNPRTVASKTLELEEMSGSAVMRDSERRQTLDMIQRADNAFQALSHARSYAQSVENDMVFTLRAMREILDSLAGLPGRKALLYVSDGLPMIAGQDVFMAVDEKFPGRSHTMMEAFNFDFSRRFQTLAAEANSNRVTFYTLDAQGLQVNPGVSAENRGRSFDLVANRTRQSNLQQSLRYLANTTGGMSIMNSNFVFPSLKRVADDFETYYSLGYQPAHFGDGRYHDIKVEVPGRKGIRVRHREGYRDHDTETRMRDTTMATLYHGYESNALGVEVEFDRQERRDDGHYLVSVVVKIPIGNLTLIPRGESYEGRARLFVGAMDGKGRTSDVQRMPVQVSIPADRIEEARSQNYSYTVTLLMRSGRQRVGIGVRDEVAAESSFLSRQLLLRSG